MYPLASLISLPTYIEKLENLYISIKRLNETFCELGNLRSFFEGSPLSVLWEILARGSQLACPTRSSRNSRVFCENAVLREVAGRDEPNGSRLRVLDFFLSLALSVSLLLFLAAALVGRRLIVTDPFIIATAIIDYD